MSYPTHSTKTCPQHGHALLITRAGKGNQVCCPEFQCTYYERLDVQLTARVKKSTRRIR